MNRLDRVFAFVFGDGCLRKKPSSKNAVLSFHHGPTQTEYMLWKLNHVRLLGFEGKYFETKTLMDKRTGKFFQNTFAETKSDRLFTEAMEIAYPKGEKEFNAAWINPKTVDEFALAIWWMDDGSLHFGKTTSNPAGQLHICCTFEEAQLCKAVLEVVLDSEVKIHRRRQWFHLYLPPETYFRMLCKIKNHVHHQLFYKCSALLGEDRSPIIPTSAGHLNDQLKEAKLRLKI